MEPGIRQSLFVLIGSIEQQLLAVKTLIGYQSSIGANGTVVPQKEKDGDLFTTAEEDEQIGQAMKIEDERQEFLQDIFEQARSKDIGKLDARI